MKFLKVLSLFAAAFFLFTACSNEEAKSDSAATNTDKKEKADAKPVKAPVLVMATNAEFPPYEFKDKGTIVGLDVDIMQAVCKKINRTLKIEDMKFDSIIPAVVAGKAHAGVAGMTVKEERKQHVDFTDTYVRAFQVIIVRPNSPIKDADGLKGKKIGVQQGTTGDTLCQDYVKEGSKVERYASGAEAVLALRNGKIDAVVIDNEPAKAYLKKNEGSIVVLDKPLSDEEYAIAVKKGNKELLDQINGALRELKASGELDKIKAKYIAQ